MSEAEQLQAVVDRLMAEFPSAPESTVRYEVTRAAREFEGARVRAFVPTLVHRAVRGVVRAVLVVESGDAAVPVSG